jgi:hypothetical protein
LPSLGCIDSTQETSSLKKKKKKKKKREKKRISEKGLPVKERVNKGSKSDRIYGSPFMVM